MNFTRILVPLDGSRLAEAVLPAACSLAQTLHARLFLLHVLEHNAPVAVHGEPHLWDAPQARGYLEAHADRLHKQGLAVEVHVHERPVDDVAVALDSHAHELAADLIAMCAHGRSNLRTQLLGSIAERILRGGSVPILLRTVRRADAPGFRLRRLLVPVDFAHDFDAAIDAAATLAKPFGASVVLLSAPVPTDPTITRLLPTTTALAREFDRDQRAQRLGELARRLRGEIGAVQTIMAAESPADAILAASDSLPADLIVLVTHVPGGLASWYDPSTAQRLLRHSDLTLLLIREL